MNLFNWFFGQNIQDTELREAFTQAQNADHAIMADQAANGVFQNYALTEASTPAIKKMGVSGPGAAYDNEGKRIFLDSDTELDLTASGFNIATPAAGNEKWVRVVIKQQITESVQRTTATGAFINYNLTEDTEFILKESSEFLSSLSANDKDIIRDSLTSTAGELIIGDLLMNDTHGASTILNSDIDLDAFDQFQTGVAANVSVTEKPGGWDQLTPDPADMQSGLEATDTWMEGHTGATPTIKHNAEDIVVDPTTAQFADGTVLAGPHAEAQMEDVATKLGTGDGTAKILGALFNPSAAGNSANANLTATRLDLQLRDLADYTQGRAKKTGDTFTGEVNHNAAVSGELVTLKDDGGVDKSRLFYDGTDTVMQTWNGATWDNSVKYETATGKVTIKDELEIDTSSGQAVLSVPNAAGGAAAAFDFQDGVTVSRLTVDGSTILTGTVDHLTMDTVDTSGVPVLVPQGQYSGNSTLCSMFTFAIDASGDGDVVAPANAFNAPDSITGGGSTDAMDLVYSVNPISQGAVQIFVSTDYPLINSTGVMFHMRMTWNNATAKLSVGIYHDGNLVPQAFDQVSHYLAPPQKALIHVAIYKTLDD